MLGRPRESARLSAVAMDALRGSGIEHTSNLANQVEALVAAGEWDEADRISAGALRAITANWPHQTLGTRVALEAGRGDFDAARAHLDAALVTVREDERGSRFIDPIAVELALWERRWTAADAAVRDALPRVRARDAALFRVQLCAQGLRAQAELATLARSCDDADALDRHVREAQKLLDAARQAATEAAAVTPNAAGWRSLAEAEYGRARGLAQPEAWSQAATTWEELERPPVVAYCRWRQAEALAARGADATDALREAHAVAARIGARPLLQELEALAHRAQLELVRT
jgi:hypothetical protein